MIHKSLESLKVGIIGEPNTGKSTLLNRIFKKKYSIVTRKAQTTVEKKIAVLNHNNKQIIFTDTPGITLYKNKLSRATFKQSFNTALESDVILLLINLKKDNLDKIKNLIEYYKKQDIKFIIVLNKIDLLNKQKFLEKVSLIKNLFPTYEIFSVSAKQGKGVTILIDYLNNINSFKKRPFIENINLSSDPQYFKEIVREKTLENIHEEIPFNLKFITEKINENKDKSITVHVAIFLLKHSYKPIILGKKGHNIKKISIQARHDLEKNLKKKIHLYIYLKIVKKKISNYRKVK